MIILLCVSTNFFVVLGEDVVSSIRVGFVDVVKQFEKFPLARQTSYSYKLYSGVLNRTESAGAGSGWPARRLSPEMSSPWDFS
jgi:hypothetical protein